MIDPNPAFLSPRDPDRQTVIKMCGLTRADDLEFAVTELDVEVCGAILIQNSPRFASLETFSELGDRLESLKMPKFPLVAVIDESTPYSIEQILAACPQAIIQFHGAEFSPIKDGIDGANPINDRWYIRALQFDTGTPKHAEFTETKLHRPQRVLWLLDAKLAAQEKVYEKSATLNWRYVMDTVLPELFPTRSYPPVLWAAGLNPENVRDLIRLVQPWGVDVSRGIESAPGIKSHNKMRDFVDAVRQTEKLVDHQNKGVKG